MLIVLAIGLLAAVPGLRGVVDRLSRIGPGWIVLGVGAEVLSGLGYVIVFEQVFRRIPRGTAFRVAWSEMAFGVVFPAGGAGGLALGSWILHRKGAAWGRLAERSAVLFMLTSAINMATLTLFGFLYAVGVLPGPHRVLLGAVPAAVGATVLLSVLALPHLLKHVVGTRTWKHQRLKTATEGLSQAVVDTRHFLRGSRWGVIGAIAYLWFDIILLWVCFLALGQSPGVGPLVLGYQIGYMANAIPVPGGIGVLDGGVIGMLVVYGVNATTATAAFLIYHAIWLFVPLVIGTVAFLLIRRHIDEALPGVLPRQTTGWL